MSSERTFLKDQSFFFIYKNQVETYLRTWIKTDESKDNINDIYTFLILWKFQCYINNVDFITSIDTFVTLN